MIAGGRLRMMILVRMSSMVHTPQVVFDELIGLKTKRLYGFLDT